MLQEYCTHLLSTHIVSLNLLHKPELASCTSAPGADGDDIVLHVLRRRARTCPRAFIVFQMHLLVLATNKLEYRASQDTTGGGSSASRAELPRFFPV